jgi:hypothetical protein
MIIEYTGLEIRRVGRVFSEDDWEEFDEVIEWNYDADDEDVVDYLVNFVEIEDDEEAYKYARENIYELSEKYEEHLKEYFRERAREDAQENWGC